MFSSHTRLQAAVRHSNTPLVHNTVNYVYTPDPKPKLADWRFEASVPFYGFFARDALNVIFDSLVLSGKIPAMKTSSTETYQKIGIF